MNGTKWLENHRWQTSEHGWVDFKFHSELQCLINTKNTKYENYLKKCDICWLVITVDCSSRDEIFEYKEEMEGKIFRSCFDKVFFFDIMSRNSYQLKIMKKNDT